MSFVRRFVSLFVSPFVLGCVFSAFCSAASWGAEPVNYAYVLDDGKPVSSTEEALPLMSVFKTHLAVAVLQKMQREGLPLSHAISIPAARWDRDTWSPLRKQYQGRSVSLTLHELLSASVSLSDNITTDILIDYLGGMPALQAAMDAIDIPCSLLRNESDMDKCPACCADNTSSLASVLSLLQGIEQGRFLSGVYQDFLVQALYACETGANKIRAGIPDALPLAHKTGSSGRDGQGLKLADNDAGFVSLPDGRVLYMALFVTRSPLSDEASAEAIAQKASEIFQQVATP